MPLEAWYMDSSEEDQRLPHRQEPNAEVTLEKVFFPFFLFDYKIRNDFVHFYS